MLSGKVETLNTIQRCWQPRTPHTHTTKQTIMINEEIAFKYGALDAGSHEVLHAVMKGALTDLKIQDNKEDLNKIENSLVDRMNRAMRK